MGETTATTCVVRVLNAIDAAIPVHLDVEDEAGLQGLAARLAEKSEPFQEKNPVIMNEFQVCFTHSHDMNVTGNRNSQK